MAFANFACLLVCLVSSQAIPRNFSKNQEKLISPSGVVVVEDCGSNGRVTQVRVSDCEATPCELNPGKNYEIEVDFSTSTNGNLWKVLVTAFAGNTSIVALDENVEAEIGAGEEHTLHYVLPVTDVFAGRDIRVQIQLIEVNTQVEEICISANAFVTLPATTESPPK